MAQDKQQIKATYPLPVYNYRVTINSEGASVVLSFAEVSGLSLQYEPVTYKHGLSYVMGDRIIPGMRQPIKVTLKRGMSANRPELHSWLNTAHSDPGADNAKRDIVVDLCDEQGIALIRWSVLGALPVKLDAPTFDANSNQVAIEAMEFIAHDLQIEYAP